MMSSRFFLSFILFSCFLSFAFCGAHMACHSSTYVYGEPNNYPVSNGMDNMVLLKTVTNGSLYRVTVPNSGGNSTQTFYLSHVYGDAYSQGYAYGQLLGDEIDNFMNSAWDYIYENVEEAIIPYLPKWAAGLIAKLGLEGGLTYVYDITKDYTSPDFYDEMRGITDAVPGLDFNRAVALHMLPGITKGACSLFGAYGSAVPEQAPHLLQLRALDWDMDGPFRDFSAINVYHSSREEDNGNNWINIGFVGFIGALTGISDMKLAISEIGVSYQDSTWGPEQNDIPVPGVPFIVLLRNILKQDTTLDDAINRMANAKRTCNLILGVGDGKQGDFKGFQYSPYVFNVFDPLNSRPNNSTWHPKIKDIVYWGMDWDCPAFNAVLSDQLKKYYGNITAQNAIQYISSVEQSGDNHIAYYDLTSMEFYVSFAAPHLVGGPIEAYSRQYTKFNALDLFSVQQNN
eukprot:TRINITY_DN8433_c0_g1_i1.p1 TRINITY_DN8433_c0_g1~~TRINITY_DN8433_c0_g1_i1.p1  ORF type:complete len:457 (+),score=165.35 TRINITY_DN8433_c0_g1_i1:79-1449(+)